jgi:hypothetical protein
MKYYNIYIDTPGSCIPVLVRRVPQSKLRQCEHGQTWFIDSEGTRHEVITESLCDYSQLASHVYGPSCGSVAADRLVIGIDELMTAYIEERRMLGYTVEESRQILLEMVGESVDSISEKGLHSV